MKTFNEILDLIQDMRVIVLKNWITSFGSTNEIRPQSNVFWFVISLLSCMKSVNDKNF